MAWRGRLGHRDDVLWSLKVRLLLRRDVTEPVPDEDLEVSAPSSLSESTRGHGGPGDSPAVDEPWGKGPIGASLGAVGQLAMGRGDSGCHLGLIIPLGDFGSLSRVGVHYVNCLVV